MENATEKRDLCRKCGAERPVTDFVARGKTCRACRKLYRAQYHLENRERTLAINKAWSLANPQNVKRRSQAWHAQNLERHAALNADWYARNKTPNGSRSPGKVRQAAMARFAAKRKATPAWLTPGQRAASVAFYELAIVLQAETGEAHEVDHIVPIRSKVVCGLHVPWNLRTITTAENRRKGNRYWPDQW